MSSTCLSLVAITGLLLTPGLAMAQPNPSFTFGKAEDVKEVKEVEWKVQAKGGLIMTTGNSQATTYSLSGLASRKQAGNKLALEASLTEARTHILRADDANMSGSLDPGELRREKKTTTDQWLMRGRYDRFFTENNSAYASVTLMRDRPAGKNLVGTGQVGYSRQLLKDERHTLVTELGYDFSYEEYVASTDAVQIHSARLFVGEILTLTKDTGVSASVELLANLNEEKEPAPGYGRPAPFEDVRAVGKLGLTTTLLSNVSFGFGFLLRYDNVPPPLPPVDKLSPAMGFFPRVEKLDTTTEASLVVTFL